MDSSTYKGGGRGPLSQQTELLGVGYRGRLLNGVGGQAFAVSDERPSVALLRMTLLQLQRVLTQNSALSDALKDALVGEEKTSALLRKQKTILQEAAAKSSAAVERARSLMASEVEAAQKSAEKARSFMVTELEKAKRAAEEAKEAAANEYSKLRDRESALQVELNQRQKELKELSLRLADHDAQQKENQRLAAYVSQLKREVEERGGATVQLECELKAAREQLKTEAGNRRELDSIVQTLREQATEKDRFLESELANKDLTFQQQLQQQESSLRAEILRRDQELAEMKAKNQKDLTEIESLHQQARREMEESHQEALKEMQAKHEEVLRDVQSKHQEVLTEIEAKHQKTLREIESNKNADCERLVEQLQAETEGKLEAMNKQLQKQTLLAQEGLAQVAQLQEECNMREAALIEARKKVNEERASREEQAKMAEAAIEAMKEAIAVKEREFRQLQEEKQMEMQRQLDEKDRNIVEVLVRRDEELKEHKAESERLRRNLQEAHKELEILRALQAKAVAAAEQQTAEVEKLHSLRKQMEKKLLQMQIEGRRALRSRVSLAPASPESPPSTGDVLVEVHTPRQPGKQRRKEAQLQVEWVDQMHPPLPESQEALEAGGKRQEDASTSIRELRDIDVGSANEGSTKGAISRSRRARQSATGSVAADSPQCPQSHSNSRNEHTHTVMSSQGHIKADECTDFADNAMHTEDPQDAEAGNVRRHSLRLRKQKSEVSPPCVASSISTPKPPVQCKKK